MKSFSKTTLLATALTTAAAAFAIPAFAEGGLAITPFAFETKVSRSDAFDRAAYLYPAGHDLAG